VTSQTITDYYSTHYHRK